MQIQISWLLQKPTDLDLHCLQRQDISGFSRTRVNLLQLSKFSTQEHWETYLYCVILLHIYTKIWTSPSDFLIRWLKCCDGMANITDPDQTRSNCSSSLIWVYTVCSGMTVQISMVNMAEFRLVGWFGVYLPSHNSMVMLSRSVYLTTLFLGRLCHLRTSTWSTFFHQKLTIALRQNSGKKTKKLDNLPIWGPMFHLCAVS